MSRGADPSAAGAAADPRVGQAVARLRAGGFGGPFALAVVAGTGLGPLAARIEAPRILPYAEIPHFPVSGVSGHAGQLVAGDLGGRPVLLFQGRAHAYEQGDAAAMRVPLGVLAALGAPPLLLTNAAGSLRHEAGPGRLALITDHLNLSGLNPLIGEHSEARFVPMVDAYDPGLRKSLHGAAAAADLVLHEGVYAWFLGPSFETPAEIRMAGRLGADLVGMSTVPEVILARFFGLRVAALSIVTNYAAGFDGGAPHHAETKRVAAAAAEDVGRLLAVWLASGGPGEG
ncbi:purine-nucleoside phosphorylase [Methylobacterium nodulans]|uniref:Purine nucleoside phosphorylase n=1 Tax=Methylobacterium nodulans (strain LMG 21967 / CNCM I-2342 / ORS 2060) TaxID=460265 RepID=B8ICG2_METNO|nr:purine-nucleoside phosphorylase [Methylobacterium nodulans]ACL55550.1 purine nucleotide phosphorylase [Methylobacterium nodulans ORS 2060]